MSTEMAVVIGAVIGACGAIAGAVVAGIGARASARLARAAEEKDQAVAAAVAYVSAVDALAAEMLSLPRPRQQTAIERRIERALSGILDLVVRIFVRLLYGFRWERLQDQYVAARARLEMVDPGTLSALLREIHDVLFKEPLRLGDNAQRWRDIRQELPRRLAEGLGVEPRRLSSD